MRGFSFSRVVKLLTSWGRLLILCLSVMKLRISRFLSGIKILHLWQRQPTRLVYFGVQLGRLGLSLLVSYGLPKKPNKETESGAYSTSTPPTSAKKCQHTGSLWPNKY